MDGLKEHVQWARGAVASTLKRVYEEIEQSLPINVQRPLTQYVNEIFSTTSQSFMRDLRNLRLTAATGTLAATAVTVFVMWVSLHGGESEEYKMAKKKKKPTKAQRVNKEIQKVLDHVEETYVPQIDKFIEEYASLTDQNKEYKFSYYQEMLLKELMKLDGIDVAGNDILRENRRTVIRFIQEHQSRLDKFRKDNW